MQEFGEKVDKVSGKVNNIGNELTTKLTVPVIGLGTVAMTTGANLEQAIDKYIATTEKSTEETEKYKKILTDIHDSNFGEDYEDIANSMAIVEQQMRGLDDAADLEKITKKAYYLKDAFGSEINESVRAAKMMMEQWGISADEAFELINQGYQKGLDKNGDFLDSINEYSVHFRQIGLSATDMFDTFKLGADSGAFSIDKVGDAIKEMGIRLKDGTATDVLKSMKLDAKELEKAFADGGERGSWAFGEIVNGLESIKDPLKQNQAGVTIFGTMWEDLGKDAVFAMTKYGGNFDETLDTMGKSMDDLYSNSKNKVETSIRRIKTISANLGSKLLPILNKILDKAEVFIDKLDDLNDEEQENIIKMGLMVAGAGPLIKVLGTTTSAVGKVSKGVGTFTQALSVMKTGGESSSKSVSLLAKVLTGLSGTAGAVTLGIGALGVSIGALVTYYKDATKEAENLKKSTEKSLKSYDDFSDSINRNLQAKLNDIDRSKILSQELEKIVDENGKIKDGYEARAKVIVNELSESLGKEITITNNVIDKYKDLQKEIDNLILKKKGEAILSANEEKYTKAIDNRTQKTQELLDIQEQLNAEQEKLKKLNESLRKDKSGNIAKTTRIEIDISAAEKNLENLRNSYNNTKKEVENYTKDINEYNYASQLVTTNTTESLTELIDSIGKTYEKNGETVSTSYKRQLQEQQTYLKISQELQNKALESHNTTEAEKTKKQIEETNTRIGNLIEELKNNTALIGDNSPDIIDAWKQLATDSYEIYKEKVSEMPPETRKKIEEITGVVTNDSTVENATEQLGKDAVSKLDKSMQAAKTAGENFVLGAKQGIENQGLQNGVLKAVGTLGSKMVSRFNASLDEHSPSKLTEDSGENFVLGAKRGVKNKEKDMYKTIESLGNNLVSKFDENMILKYSQIEKMQKLQGGLKSTMIDSTKTIFTTPQIVFNVQELDKARLEQCFQYINKKFGTMY